MAISQRHRSSIYTRLEPILGEEEAEALLAQFPARELDEPVSREFVHGEIERLRADMNEGFGAARAELASEVGSLRAEMAREIGSLRSEMNEQVGSLRAEMNDKFRAQTVWFSGTMLAGLGLAAAVGRLMG